MKLHSVLSVVVAAVLLAIPSSFGAVTLGTTADLAFDLNSSTTASQSFTVSSGSDRALVLAISSEGMNAVDFLSGTWTVGQDVQNFLVEATSISVTSSAVYYLANPTVGSGTIEITVDGNSFGGTSGARAYNFTGVQSFLADSTAQEGTATDVLNFASLPTDSYVVTSVGTDDGTPSFQLNSGSGTINGPDQLSAPSTETYVTTVSGASGDIEFETTVPGAARYAYTGVALLAVPEPSAMTLLLGLGGLALLLRRRRSS